MAGRLLDAGYQLTVFNRTHEKAWPLIERGARWADSPKAVASAVDVVITMVIDGGALRAVTLGEDGLLAGARPGQLLIDMSTVSLADSAIVARACEAAGVDYLRAPVTGSTVLAARGSLGTLASGPRKRYEEALPIFQVFGPRQFYLGPGDEARSMKLALNMLIGITMVGLSEGLLLAEKSGLDWQQTLEVYCQSAVGSPFVNYKAPPLADRDFDPTFTTRGICKDFDLAIEAARNAGAATPLTVLTRQLFQAAVDGGWGDRDFSAVLLYLERASGIEPVDRTAG
jgi:3-hydroxyisobutyrate dehydrogenase-like beta-hydroxyacid dehydrogenase